MGFFNDFYQISRSFAAKEGKDEYEAMSEDDKKQSEKKANRISKTIIAIPIAVIAFFAVLCVYFYLKN